MAGVINLAEKYSQAVQERFYKDSLTESSFSKDLDVEFTGVKTVKVYEVDTAPVNDYTRSGANRYGTPQELTDSLQEFVMTQDKASTWTIDKGNAKEQFNIKVAATSLKRQMREVITPMIDKYRFAKWAENAGHAIAGAIPTKDTIVESIMDMGAWMDDQLVPTEGRTLYIRNDLFKVLKLNSNFIPMDKASTNAIVKGVVGEIDGMPVKKVPTSYFPENVFMMIIRKDAAISPMKLNDYKIHKDPPGISGDLVEMRVIYDAFVKGTKMNGIVLRVLTNKVVATPTVSMSGATATVSCSTSGATIMYTTDGSDPRYSESAKVYSGTVNLNAGDTIKACATKAAMFRSDVAETTYAG